jgi:outer membrane protein TolC
LKIRHGFLSFVAILIAVTAMPVSMLAGQQAEVPAPQPLSTATIAHAAGQTADNSSNEPKPLTLQEALALAKQNSVQFQSALTDAGITQQDSRQALALLLPSAIFNTSAIYTQSNGPGLGVKFIANNGVHEYISQGNVHETLDLASVAAYRRAAALGAASKARAEIAARGLVVTVVQNYFAVSAAEQKLETAKRTADEGQKFLQLTQDLEKGGEAAHSDVIKAELQAQDRKRQLQEAQLGLLNARLNLAVLLFPDFRDNFKVVDDLHATVPLPARDEFEVQAARDNPDIRAALSTVKAAGQDVNAARAGYLPIITLDYFYGIDANRYAVNSVLPPPDNTKYSNLGSAATAALTWQVWNWGTTQSRITQAELRRAQTKRELSLAQRTLLSEMRSLYAEAETALDELSGLQRSAELSADSLRLTTLRYKNGEATVLEVVDAQTSFALANSGYQDGAVRYRVALANLQTLTGVLTNP